MDNLNIKDHSVFAFGLPGKTSRDVPPFSRDKKIEESRLLPGLALLQMQHSENRLVHSSPITFTVYTTIIIILYICDKYLLCLGSHVLSSRQWWTMFVRSMSSIEHETSRRHTSVLVSVHTLSDQKPAGGYQASLQLLKAYRFGCLKWPVVSSPERSRFGRSPAPSGLVAEPYSLPRKGEEKPSQNWRDWPLEMKE